MDVKEMAKLGAKARWKNKTAKEKSDHGKLMAEAKRIKKLKKLSPPLPIQKKS